MKAREIRKRTEGDLREELKRMEKEVFQRRFRSQSEEKTDHGFVRRTRRDVARIHTVLRERERAAAATPAAAPAKTKGA